MPTPRNEALALWAKQFASPVQELRSAGTRIDRELATSIILNATVGITDDAVREAMTAVAVTFANGTNFEDAVDEHPKVFDRWFRSVVRYGTLYNELDKALLRYADRPQEMAFNYFGIGDLRCDSRWRSLAEAHVQERNAKATA